jgi:hypothetical protein
VVDEDPSAGTSRRALLARGAAAAGGSALALAGCGGASRHHHLAPAVPTRETPLVRELLTALELERRTVAAYAAGIPLLAPRAREAARRFLDFELSHAGEIAGLIEQAGTKPPKPSSVYDLGRPQTPQQVLGLLRDLERRQLAMYLDLVPRISDGKVRAAITAVLGSDAQHVAVLSALAGSDPLGSPIL